ncbi:MAG TPA: alpha/beta fold hydrolase, partial [Rectinemataceae bacterium]|nr:alpha/beta fold hydrolase [Rectinemataceae bacterium]
PYPYKAIEVSFTNPAAGIDLSGTLTLPEGRGPFPAVVLVTGSGAQNRDEEILGHKPFLVIADYLARRGIAALRYDDRGVGASKGVFATATTLDFAGDAEAAAACLVARPEIDAKRIGIAGHSEGAIVAAIAASRDPVVSFIVMLAGPGVRGDRLLLLQNAALARAAGADESFIEQANKINASLYAIAMRPGDSATLREEIISALMTLRGADAASSEAKKAGQEAQSGLVADQLLSPWFRAFLSLDPAAYLAKVSIPVLAMNGSKDLQVPADDNLPAIGRALESAGNRRYTLLKLDGLNHLFQHAGTGRPEEYGTITETFAPEALAAMGDWIASVALKGE